MNNEEIISHIDHTLLKAFSTWDDIVKLCDEAVKYKTASVCVPPYYVKRIRENYPDLDICTVVGFPLGYETTTGKVADTKQCIDDGADEIDMVINICEVKNGNFDYVENEIRALKEACKGKILKVIVETCYLTEDEKKRVCKCVTNAKADYIKTSTGFGTQGATIEDIKLFAKEIGPDVKIKAAGGIRTRAQAEEYIENGCDRVGASSVVSDIYG
ncbi:MAG: deoxyribose-phosphate aldolase [Lachnospiraceae bacterium]|nr:deoxyribose-phosphate aldolase [Lachnospiraceae bacterium]